MMMKFLPKHLILTIIFFGFSSFLNAQLSGGTDFSTAVELTETRTDISISSASAGDYFKISVPETSNYSIYTTNEYGSYDTWCILYDESQMEITSNDDYTDLNFRIETTLSPGIYYLNIGDFDMAGIPSIPLYIEGTGFGSSPPSVTTDLVSNIAETSATIDGSISDLGTPNPTAHGVCWNTTGSPTISDRYTNIGGASTTGTFSSFIASLDPNTTYYVRAYATNDAGTSYGSELIFKTLQKELYISGTSVRNKVYDGTTDAIVEGAYLTGVISGDDVSLANATSGTFAQADAGANIPVNTSMSLTGADAYKYYINQPTGLVADIIKKELTVSGAAAENKVYDGTLDASITGASLDGIITGDLVSIDATSGTFASSDVAAGIAVTPALTITGDDAGNYTLTQPSGLAADITRKELTVSGAYADDKVYDGNSNANISGGVLNGIISGDLVSINSTSGSFTNTDVGTGIIVAPDLNLSGEDAGNYILSQPAGLKANITPKELTVSGAAAENKVYDGTLDASITGASLNGVITGDLVSVDATSGTFASSDVATGIAVTPALTITGDDAGNYTLSQPSGLSADITPKELTVSGAAAENKVYDGTLDASITGASLNGVITGDLVSVDATSGTFASSDVATGIAVTPALTITGDDAGNYTLSQPSGLSADITPKELTVSGAAAENKVYDGTLDASITGASLNGVITGNLVSIDATSGTFASSDVATGIAVTPALTITGDDAGNYTLTQPSGLSADITPKELTVSGAAAENKVYDGTLEASITGASLNGVITGDLVSIDATSGTFASSDVATGIAVTPALTITGDDAGNYTLTQPSGLSADITPKELTVSGAAAENKVYDGTLDASITGASLNGVITGDLVSVDATSGTFASSDVATGIAVTPALTITGDDAGNYTLSQPSGLSADITPKELTVSGAAAENKVYDGTLDASITGASLNGVITGDLVSVDATSGTFASSDVATGIAVTPALTITGDDAGNYTLSQPSGLSGDITPKEITISGSFTVNDKEYDGTNEAVLVDNQLSLEGVNENDKVYLINIEVEFESVETGSAIPVFISKADLGGDDSNNYHLSLKGSPETVASISSTTGIKNDKPLNIKTYPNPFIDRIWFDNVKLIERVVIFDSSGKQLMNVKLKGKNSIYTYNLPDGFYYLTLIDKEGNHFVRKMVKQSN